MSTIKITTDRFTGIPYSSATTNSSLGRCITTGSGTSNQLWYGTTPSYNWPYQWPQQIYPFKLTEPEAQKEKTMSLIKKLKDLTLDADSRILRKNGFEDDNGKMTEAAEDMMDDEIMNERWKARRAEIAADLRKLEEEEK